MGSPKKPVALAQGHRARTVAPLRIVSGVADQPEPPRGLLKRSRDHWEAFWASDVARAVDPLADAQRLERWITQVDEWNRGMAAFRRERFVLGSQGQPVLNPLAAYLAKLETAIASSECEFGMTPLSRMRLGIATGEAAMTAQRLNEMTRSPAEPVDGEHGYEPA